MLVTTIVATLSLGVQTSATRACSPPEPHSVAAAFDLAAANLLPAGYPHLPASSGIREIPVSILKAIGWVESHWEQDRADGAPLVSFDFGYGIMQITSGMAGAFGNVTGSLPASTQTQIASDYMYNIGYGAALLARKWEATPPIGDRNPAEVENWYYALWAYNGWGWANNPNNPRLNHQGNPGSNPTGFPYQERVLYYVAHPPKDADGNSLWPAIPVSLPSRRAIGRTPGKLAALPSIHRQNARPLDVAYEPPALAPAAPGATISASVGILNTGTATWAASGTNRIAGNYHLFAVPSNPWKPFSTSARNYLSSGASPVMLTHNIAPGETAFLTFRIRLPSKKGTYRLAWDPKRGSNWFSRLGVKPFIQTVHVGPPDAMSTPTVVSPPAIEDLRYVADTSVPDGSVLAAGQSFRKGWLIFNAGAKPWTSSTVLMHRSGPALGRKMIVLPALQSCRAGNVIAPMKAPKKSGAYRSIWRMAIGNTAAGDPLSVVFSIPGGSDATPTPPAPPTTSPIITPTPTPVG